MKTAHNVDRRQIRIKIGMLIREGEYLVRLKISPDAELDAADIEQVFSQSSNLVNYQPYCLLTDARVPLTATKEAREFAANNTISGNVIANAILIRSLPVALLANFYIKFNRPKIHSRMFRNEKKALEWIDEAIRNYFSESGRIF